MGRSTQLRLSDVRTTFRILGECRDLRGDCDRWIQHLLAGLRTLLRTRAAKGFHARFGAAPKPLAIEVVQYADVGFEPEHQRANRRMLRLAPARQESNPSPPWSFDPACHLKNGQGIWTRRQLVDDQAWYQSDWYRSYYEPPGIDHHIHAIGRLPNPGLLQWITLYREFGDRDFSIRERKLVRLLQEELAPLVGPVLAAPSSLAAQRLSPRLRQTLELLLQGESEKSAAARLKLSRTTVHQYVMDLYRHYGVNSRAELLATFVNRPIGG